MTGSLVEGRSLRKCFARTVALNGASVSVDSGEIVAVTGASGSGKSTLMLCLAGVLLPESGQVSFDGARLDGLGEAARARLRRREFGLVLQFGQLVTELNVLDNVSLPLLLDGHNRVSAAKAAQTWLERLGAGELVTALPGDLSGGEAQRVAIARALVTGPRVIFADEPTGALDSVSAADVITSLVAAAKETGAALVLITHDNKVAAHADREIVICDGRADQREARP